MEDGYNKWFREQVLRAAEGGDERGVRWASHEHVKADMAAQQAILLRRISASPSHASSAEDVQKLKRDVPQIISAATELMGSRWNALYWLLNEPLSAFDDKTAEQLVLEGRTEDVLRYIKSLEAGATG
ncbi:antitoxin Xre/MbcA/ParS toxin-binding domain-containing protein [Burkholderia pseudomallei]|uniref:antitoxin Xre/MbcA/ParS toxin-binding domain-containing protein n=1 Tax=Burkholderia pseudomallei TaxID=28450 RepID=UPI00016B24D1|nr:antitoxin Xre/MbcA/ParS toxin-binding domain-containing protein [Burkholderia pseudomallei]